MIKIEEASLGSMVTAYNILKTIIQPFNKFDAYKLGLIDAKGKKLKKAVTPEEKKAVSMSDRIAINLKRIIQNTLGGSTLSKAVLAAYLLKEGQEEPDDIVKVIVEHYIGDGCVYALSYPLDESEVRDDDIEAILKDSINIWEGDSDV